MLVLRAAADLFKLRGRPVVRSPPKEEGRATHRGKTSGQKKLKRYFVCTLEPLHLAYNQ